ncbi:AMP-binding protein [Actinophytocola sediminis]
MNPNVIGSVEPGAVLAEALRWRGGDEVDDLPPWPHPQLRAATVERAATTGGLMVCSGGTTGSPKLTVLAPDLGVPKVLAHWRPLVAGDVLLNLFSTGKMWGAQYFYNAVATHSRAVVAPAGSFAPAEFAEWSAEIAGMGVTALAGAPNVLARFADMVAGSDLTLPVRSVIWSGEPLTPAHRTRVLAAFPDAGFWGNYGSIETFVIGVSRPDCDLSAVHLLPDQLLELEDDGALLTRVGEGWPTPAVRFRLGDRVRPVDCSCGGDNAFTVLGRADDNVKFFGTMVLLGDVLNHARTVEGVFDAQLVVYRDPDVPSAVLSMTLLVTGSADPSAVRRVIVGAVEDLGIVDAHTPEAFTVAAVAEVTRNERTNKVLPVVWESAAEPVAR